MTKTTFAEREECTVYVLNGITYLPHYLTPSMYVSPGYHWFRNPKMYTANELRTNGASEQKMMLWPRPKHSQNQPDFRVK